MVIHLLRGKKTLWILHQMHPVNIKHECHDQMLLLAYQRRVPFPFLLYLAQIVYPGMWYCAY